MEANLAGLGDAIEHLEVRLSVWGQRYEEGRAFECLVKLGELSSLKNLQLGRPGSKTERIHLGDCRSKLLDAEGS
jgi:hypothetical protein